MAYSPSSPAFVATVVAALALGLTGTAIAWNAAGASHQFVAIGSAYLAAILVLSAVAAFSASGRKRGIAAGAAAGLTAAIVLVGLLGVGAAFLPSLLVWAVLVVLIMRTAGDFQAGTAATSVLAGFGTTLVLVSVVAMTG